MHSVLTSIFAAPMTALAVIAPAPEPIPLSTFVPDPIEEMQIIDEAIVEAEQPDPEPVQQAPARSHWDDLADCESGEWTANGHVQGSARWDSRSHGLYQGGLQFHPGTWDAYRDPSMPSHAADASRNQQIIVGERVQQAQGWKAWPVCSRRVGLR